MFHILFMHISLHYNAPFQPSASHHGIIGSIALPPPSLPALRRPWEMRHGNDKERIAIIQQSGQHVIPSNKSRNNSKSAASPGQGNIRVPIRSVTRIEIADSKADESDPDGQEKRVERHGGLQREQPHEECEDEPAEDLKDTSVS